MSDIEDKTELTEEQKRIVEHAKTRIPSDENKEYGVLVYLKNELYHSDWIEFLEDLRDRLKGRPYIFKLVNRAEEDIDRIEKLQEFEIMHQGKYTMTDDELGFEFNKGE